MPENAALHAQPSNKRLPDRRIGVLANPELRTGPSSPLVRLIRELAPYFSGVAQVHLHCVEGSFRAILRNGLLHDYENLHLEPAGYIGGLVAITAMVVQGRSNESTTSDGDQPALRPLDAVIYLVDPRDPTSLYPESIALKRECVVAEKTFLPTYCAAREWATLLWYCSGHSSVNRHFLSGELARNVLRDAVNPVHLPIEQQTIALIAHDAKKKEMLQFAFEEFELLSRFKKRIGTGTTGRLLNGDESTRYTRERMEEGKFVEEFERLKARLEAEGLLGRWVDPKPSGPFGGDVQIAEDVRQGACQKVVFFEDPFVAREHEADIQLLERTARIPGQDIICLHDLASAREWAGARRACRDRDGDGEPLTLVKAFEVAFDGVELIGCDGGEGERSAEEIWGELLECAAWYVLCLVSHLAHKRTGSVRVAVTWGVAMHELVERLRKISADLRRVDRWISARGSRIDPQLAAESFLRPGNVVAVPLVGVMGTTDPRVEANQNASQLAEFFGGRSEPLASCVFIDKAAHGDGAEGSLGVEEPKWEDVDVAIFSGETVKEKFGTKATAPVPAKLYRQMKGSAIGEIGGLFLDRDGNEVEPSDYVRVGMPQSALRKTARKRGAVLLAGLQDWRVESALAAIRGGMVSALVSDLAFARELLTRHYVSR